MNTSAPIGTHALIYFKGHVHVAACCNTHPQAAMSVDVVLCVGGAMWEVLVKVAITIK